MNINIYFTLKELRGKLYGININLIFKALTVLGFSYNNLYYNKKIKLSEKELLLLYKFLLSHFITDLKLRDKIFMNIKKLKTLKTYKGFRHKYFLPVNGQRTKTNAQTWKRKKKKLQ